MLFDLFKTLISQLRNLELNFKNAMDSIAEYIKEERDVLYLRGQEKIIESLLTKLNYSLEQIADIAGVSVDFVKSVKQKLASK